MGNLITGAIVEKQREGAIQSRLADLKQMKKQRDFTMAMNMAQVRERIFWMLGFYGTMSLITVTRVVVIRRIEPLPLKSIPLILVPFMVGYQIDYAYGTKSDRIYKEARKILTEEEHWFNEPAELPEILKEPMLKLERETNEKLLAMGKKPEKPWAK
ncbi:hypothetical protein AKO1_007705 [Acrasis kona]|uniref:Plasminogen receptor (KT) n=1 Tax=Acrasis kona TaxID=1008807 RepID=A0AAW2YR39_9EUKA